MVIDGKIYINYKEILKRKEEIVMFQKVKGLMGNSEVKQNDEVIAYENIIKVVCSHEMNVVFFLNHKNKLRNKKIKGDITVNYDGINLLQCKIRRNGKYITEDVKSLTVTEDKLKFQLSNMFDNSLDEY